jgi:membrane associated rhomboid family serine protease
MNFIDDFKYNLRQNNNLTVLIYINLAFFLIISLLNVGNFLFTGNLSFIVNWLGIPAYFPNFLTKPWTIITYMFTHQSFLHILFNILFLYWFGQMFVQYLNQRQLLGLYILGGFAGAVLYMIAFNFFPVFSAIKYVAIAIGASASVMAIIIAVASLTPNQTVYLLFFGQVKLKYIAIAVVFLDIISIPTDNAGGHIAHLGGAITGFIFTYYYKKNTDITRWIVLSLQFIKELFVPDKNIKVSYKSKSKKTAPETDMEYNRRKKEEQKEIDIILDKISKSGYKSLTDKEKEKLFKSSNKN